MNRWKASSSPERRQFLLSLPAKEKAYIILLEFSKLEQLSAKVGDFTEDEKVFIRETLTQEESASYNLAISLFHF